MKKTVFFVFIILALLSVAVNAQTTSTKAKPAPKSSNPYSKVEFQGFIYHSEKSFGFRYQSNGWNFFIHNAKILHERKTRFTEFEFGHIRHEKEVKSASYIAGGGPTPPKSYVFGKQYSLYNIHYRIGFSHLIAYKSNRNGVAVSFNYSAGPSLGILKPYYLILYYNDSNNGVNEGSLKTEKFSEANQALFLDPNHIYGYAGFFKGLFQPRFAIGVTSKIGLNFDFSSYFDRIKAIEVGLMNDTYINKTPIMIYTTNHKIWTSFYMSMQFGSRK